MHPKLDPGNCSPGQPDGHVAFQTCKQRLVLQPLRVSFFGVSGLGLRVLGLGLRGLGFFL